MVNYESLTTAELEKLIADLELVKKNKEAQDRVEDLKDIRDKIKRHGITATELKGAIVLRRRKIKSKDLSSYKLQELTNLGKEIEARISQLKTEASQAPKRRKRNVSGSPAAE